MEAALGCQSLGKLQNDCNLHMMKVPSCADHVFWVCRFFRICCFESLPGTGQIPTRNKGFG